MLHDGVDVLVLVEEDAGVPLVGHLRGVLLEFAGRGLRIYDGHLAVEVGEALGLETIFIAGNHNRALARRVVVALARRVQRRLVKPVHFFSRRLGRLHTPVRNGTALVHVGYE